MEAGDHPALYLPLGGDFLEMPSLPTGPADPVLTVRGLEAIPGNPHSVALAIDRLQRLGVEVVIAMDGQQAADRVARVLAEEGVAPPVISQGIHRGFVAPDLKLAVLGEQEIAGRRRAHRSSTRKRADAGVNYADLTAGDYVVHQRYGIGRFDGLTSRTMAGIEARTDEGVIDEISLAYKSLDDVIGAQKDLVEVVQKLDTILCVKG